MNASSSAGVTVTAETISASGSIDMRLQDCQNDVFDAGKKFRKRVARGRGIEQKLRVDDVLVAIGIERENAHAGCRI